MSTVKQREETSGARLTVANLAVEAGGSRLLSGIDLEIEPGEIVTLAGPSGSGKTVLLRSICGLQDPAEGEVRLGGRFPGELGWPAFRRQVVYLSQRPVLHDTTVEENLARPFAYHAARGGFSPHNARGLLRRLGLPPDTLAHAARDLSEGQQQRVALARALLVEPAFLLLDEPTSALDPDSRDAVEVLLREEASEKGRGLLVVTHDPAQAERLGHLRLRLEARAGAGTGRRDFILTGDSRRAPPAANEPGSAEARPTPGRPEPGGGA